MKYGLIGEKLGHSFSKEIHEKLGRYEYELKELRPDELESFIKAADFEGINVTIPYKEDVIPYLDELSDLAAKAGAVNTIVNKDGRLTGYNTDIGGMKLLFERLGVDMKGRTVLIAGSGGTSKTALTLAEEFGAEKAVRVSRSGREEAVTYEKAYSDYKDADILINTTPLGMYPDVDGAAFDIDEFEHIEGVIDAVYNPLRSALVRTARDRGIPAEGGLYMLVAQAMLAAGKFTGDPVSADETDRIYEEILRDKSNLVLIGMPGSGKTSYGSIISEKHGREIIETDDEVVKAAGMEISDIFEKYGEKYFRDLESEVIKKASLEGSKIISTGGGAILRKENVDALSMNGTLIFLNRPLEEIMPTEDRPLANDREKIKELYTERLPIYMAAADSVVDLSGWNESDADKIWRAAL